MLCVLYVFKTDIVNHNYCAGYARLFPEAFYCLQEPRDYPPELHFLFPLRKTLWKSASAKLRAQDAAKLRKPGTTRFLK